MFTIEKGQYGAGFATGEAEVEEAQNLRGRSFLGSGARDRDAYDERCHHVLIRRISDRKLVCCFRIMIVPSGRDIGQSYSAQFYDLGPLEAYPAPLVEMGRFCITGDLKDPDVLRLAWAVLSRIVVDHKVGMLFGCASFVGTDPQKYGAVFSLLAQKFIGPADLIPRIKSKSIISYGHEDFSAQADGRNGHIDMPPLLRSYLGMGGWVSDHAVIDTSLKTLHVFTALEVKNIPKSRAQLLKTSAN